MLDKDESGLVEFPEFVRVMAKRAEVEGIKQKTQEFREALKVSPWEADLRPSNTYIYRFLTSMEMEKLVQLSLGTS